MNHIYLENHDHFTLLLDYSPNNGSFNELKRSALPANATLWRGYYVNVRDHVYGYYATIDGPVFFHNEKRYLLADQKYTAKVKIGTDENEFMLEYSNYLCVKVKYPPIKYKNYDNWSDDLMVDFFLWIADALSDHRRAKFVQSNTISVDENFES